MNRIIKTSLKGDIAEHICGAIIGQMSDGYWENTPNYEKYWRFINVKKLSNGRIAFVVDEIDGKYNYDNKFIKNGFFMMSDTDVISFIAKKIKFILSKELISNGMKLSDKFYNEKTVWLSHGHSTITVKDVMDIITSLTASAIIGGVVDSSMD